MSSCLVTTVSEWFANDCSCPTQSSQQDQTFFNTLFTNFYAGLGTPGIWIPGVTPGTSTEPTDEQLNFQSLLADLCNQPANGGKCSSLWTQQCQNYTRSDAEHPLIRQFCGCYLPEDQYNGLSTDLRACDPLCSGLDTVQFFPSATATQPQQCTTDVCIIDDVTINVINSDLGNITFQQICQNCGPGNCRCIISDINILAQNSDLGQLNLQQNCGSATECFAIVNGQNQAVPCDQYLTAFGLNAPALSQTRTRTLTLAITYGIIAFLLIILIMVSLFLYFRSPAK